jgi:high affinity Mn2+ porin
VWALLLIGGCLAATPLRAGDRNFPLHDPAPIVNSPSATPVRFDSDSIYPSLESPEFAPQNATQEGNFYYPDQFGDSSFSNADNVPTFYSAHGQATVVMQAHGLFRSPYIGPRSLIPDEPAATSITSTLFLDTFLWREPGNTGELVFNPEIAGGRGLSNVNGIAGFPNGEIPRVGGPAPTPYFARIFVRHVWGLGGETEEVEDDANQIASTRDVNRFTLLVGKMAATDFVDNNRYSHDPRTQFLPWSMMYNGAWDYPANVRGYTYGYGLEYNSARWAFRYGAFAMPAVANGAPIDPHFLKANGQVLEWEGRTRLWDRPGAVRLLTYINGAKMGNYSESLALMPVNPDITATREYRIKYGVGANFEQELTDNLGFWIRLGWNDGHTESFAFTVIDRSLGVGLLLQGDRWGRSDDEVGLGFSANGLAQSHRAYLAAGGLDFLLGDGQLRYGPEEILDLYYNYQIAKGIQITTDFQGVNNPAYNRDRGPVGIMTLRAHIDF